MQILSSLLNLEMVCGDLTLSGSQFYSTGAAMAKACQPIAFLGQTEEVDSQKTSKNLTLNFNWIIGGGGGGGGGGAGGLKNVLEHCISHIAVICRRK